MGVPAFFRWLSKKYASIVVHCVEEKTKVVEGTKVPVDSSQKNPNDVEFDNLYLDMNGIIHPCCHPEDKPAPKNEDEMMVLIFEYIDRIFAIVRPRQLLYMAIDGVAPRAKMNQQRSRRFRASQENVERQTTIARLKAEMRAKGLDVPPDKPAGEHFDSNCITPGTPFMHRLAECLRYYVHERLNNDPGWKDVKVILSDANVPGEGEHKIMDYIRHQRSQPDHNPNTHHCLCGADADLIMLGLATHEPLFTIIREEFKPNKPRSCEICAQVGHEMSECTGVAKEKQGEFDELSTLPASEQEFIFIRITILREYLEKELSMTNLPFTQDIERAIDDWVFMCFFVGNDFLPHLPSLEIREGAIDRLVRLYKKAVYKTGGYLTENGVVNLARVQLVLTDLGEMEDQIFKQRRETELDFRRRDKERKKRQKMYSNASRPSFMAGGQFAPVKPLMGGPAAVANPRQEAYQGRMQALNKSNEDAADKLRSMLTPADSAGAASTSVTSPQGTKRKAEDSEEEEVEPADDVKLWEDGWKDRYYENKFAVSEEDLQFRHKVASEYVIGLCWVLRYYYQGCASWKWYFPYHYAPFASDFVNISDLPNDFERNTEPFKPLEQLMGVFPAGSKKFIPPSWQTLMYEEESPIIDFYPTNFKIDLNGKKYAWQGVALLPFVDEKRLKAALKDVYPNLAPDEIARNVRGEDRLFVGPHHPSHDLLEALYEGGGVTDKIEMDTSVTQGMQGLIWCDDNAVLTGGTFRAPICVLEDIQDNRAICVHYTDPQFADDYIFEAKILPGAKIPAKVLRPADFEAMERSSRGGGRGRGRGRGGGGFRPQLGFTPNSGYRDNKDSSSMLRHVRGAMGNEIAPPSNYGGRQQGYGGGHRGNRDDRRDGGSYGNRDYGGRDNRNYDSRDHGNGGGGYGSYRGQGGGGYGNNSAWNNRSGGGGYQQQGGHQQRMESYSTSRDSRQGGGYGQNSNRGGSGYGQSGYGGSGGSSGSGYGQNRGRGRGGGGYGQHGQY